jgi:hypothetical protein
MKTRLIATAAAGLALALLTAGAALAGGHGKNVVYTFRGHLLASPPANATSLSLSVEGGNHRALRAMLGQSVDQAFAVGTGSEFLKWSHGAPTVVGSGDLAAGDWVTVDVRAARGSALAEVESRPAATVGDRGPNPGSPDHPLYLFRGTIAGSGSGSVTVDVGGGNRRALRLLVGQSHRQTFATGDETIYLLWQGKVPTVIDAAQLRPGDRVVVRVRAAARSTLAQVESTPARRVAEHEHAR